MGSCVAVGFYRFIKVLEYETANPGQDFNEHEADQFEFDEENAATGDDVARPIPDSMLQTRTNSMNPLASPPVGLDGRPGLSSQPSGLGVGRPGAVDGPEDARPEKIEEAADEDSFEHAARAESGEMPPPGVLPMLK